jgi:hypothetical protein
VDYWGMQLTFAGLIQPKVLLKMRLNMLKIVLHQRCGLLPILQISWTWEALYALMTVPLGVGLQAIVVLM